MSINSKVSSTQSTSSKDDIENTAGLRKVAIQKLKEIMAGTADLDEVKAFCQVTNVILGTLKVEIDYLKVSRREQAIPFITETKLIEQK